MVTNPMRILRTWKETADTVTFELAPGKKAQFHFQPGQINMLYAFGIGEIPISISGDPNEPEKLVHTVRAVGAVSSALCGLSRDDSIGVRGPYGSTWPVEESKHRDIVIIGGGIGLAPLRPAILQFFEQRPHYGSISILYGARSPDEMLFTKQLQEWRGRFDAHVQVTVDAASDDWHGSVGVVTQLVSGADFDPLHTTALVCGPEIMMHFTIQELKRRGLKDEDIYVSMERNMKCAICFCGHYQFGPFFVCKDGPVFRYDQVHHFLKVREV